MRINELLNESEVLDEITRPMQGNAEYMLEKAGYEKIGNGIYANVFAKPGADHVLKLFGYSDLAYKDFVNMTIQNPNIHFPKFKGKLMKVTKDYYAIRMELLTPLPKDKGDALQLIKNYIYAYIRDSFQPFYGANQMAMDNLEKAQPGITEAAELVATLIKNNDLGLDLHMKNAMMRGNTIVITDPVI
jgi:hypothetical protein